ncbi:Hypothetical predicted protein [Octopus vulgaris]|uniref:Uncharacterized protein n=1 Tax=Octopus vulgaris TaxID=6645 RepID=A0AA36B519_OCTVU|nr:Hypothetical predicted protein [Octopus vulgaris]
MHEEEKMKLMEKFGTEVLDIGETADADPFCDLKSLYFAVNIAYTLGKMPSIQSRPTHHYQSLSVGYKLIEHCCNLMEYCS